MPALLRLSVLMEPVTHRLKTPAPGTTLYRSAGAWRSPSRTSIIEYRLTSGMSRPTNNPDWRDWEDGFFVLRLALHADKRCTSFDSAIAAFISLRAAARWLARNLNSEAALLRDLALLATTEIALSASLRVPTLHGAWVGRMIKVTDTSGQLQIVRAARTYIADDMADWTPPLAALAGNRAAEQVQT